MQHAVLMVEMEDSFAGANANPNASPYANANASGGNPLELRQWREVDMTRRIGSAARPIVVDDDGDDDDSDATTVNGDGASSGTLDRLWGHAVHASELSPGDQIYAYRGAIQHHGIVVHVPAAPGGASSAAVTAAAGVVVGAHRPLSPLSVHVVHFDALCDGVETTDLEAFLKGGKLRRATYSSSVWSSSVDFGASYSSPADEPALIVRRAKEAAKFGEGASGWSGYSLLTNNCETFACWCCTGRRQTLSRQATRGLVGGGVVAASVSAGVSVMASAGGVASAGVAARAMVAPRGFCGLHKAVKTLELVTGAAMVAVSLADAVSTLATRASPPSPATAQDDRREA
ncbi:unnamed protein product [Laminaria digitata]